MFDLQPYPEWYDQWMTYHLDLFCINEATVSASFMRWWPAFESMNVTPSEMKEASDLFKREGDSPARIAQHFDRMLQQIADIRTRRDNLLAIKRTLDADVIGACTDCGDSGYAAVPHPACVGTNPDGSKFWKEHHYGEAGNPIFYRASVVCICPAGRKVKDWQERVDTPKKGKKAPKPAEKKRALLLEDYSVKLFEGWRQQAKIVEDRLKTLREVKNIVDSDPEQLVKSLAKSTIPPPRKAAKKGSEDARASTNEKGRPEKAVRSADERPAAAVKGGGPGPAAAAPKPPTTQQAVGGDEEIPF